MTSDKVLLSLQALCSRREYCSSDIRAKALEKLDGDSEAANKVLEELISNKFVDDYRYACAFARDKAVLSAWGPVKIRYALSAKKIDSRIIAAALEEISSDKAIEKLDNLLVSKYKTIQSDPYARLKLIKFALSRGYEYDTVKTELEKLSL